MNATSDARTRLRMAGQADLGAWVEAATGTGLWSVQRRIASASSKYRARVSVPSCVASGKTHLAGRLALAFYDSFTPGTPCTQCGGPCGGAKVITIASKFEHLRDVLWGEIRSAYTLLADRGLAPEGTMSRGQNLRLQSDPGHYLIGVSPHQPEGLQGIHGPHVFVIGDEATAVSEEVTKGLGSTLATGDARLLLIFNPTTPDTWAYQVTQAPATEVIKITAWDTPHFTGETPAPSGLLTPEYLEELQGMGDGSGCFDPETEVLTDSGWKAFPKLSTDDRVWSQAPSGACSWEPITKIHQYPYTGDMIRLESRSLDWFVTPNHRIPRYFRKSEEWRLTEVRDFGALNTTRRDSAVTGGTDHGQFVFEVGGYSGDLNPGGHGGHGGSKRRRWEIGAEDMAELCGWWVSEGSATWHRNTWRISIAQNPGAETDRIRALLATCGLGNSHSGRQFQFSNRALGQWLVDNCGRYSNSKRIPDFVKNGTPAIQARFYIAYELGDGHSQPNGGARLTTVSRELADDLHALLARYGVAGRISTQPPYNNNQRRYVVQKLCGGRQFWVERKDMRAVPYEGDVWCLSTPHQTFLARRNDCHAFWSGNSFTWTTKIQADFWELGDTLLIPAELFDGSADVPHVPGTRALGIDLAPYGDDLNVIAFRDGNGLVKLSSFPSMRQDMFWRGPVLDAVRSFAPDYLIWDADGVGAGVYGEAEYVQSKFNQNGGNLVLMPFRGGVHVTAKFTNARAAWWWSLRQRFENGGFSLQVKDDRLRSELTGIRYSVTDAGDIRVETKGEMRKRNMKSPNFADAVTYSFSMVEELPTPARVEHSPLSDWAGVRDHSPDAMWRRNRELLKTRGQEQSRTPSSRLAQGQLAWDDI